MYPDEMQGLLGQWAKLQRPNQIGGIVQPSTTNVQKKQFVPPDNIFNHSMPQGSISNQKTGMENPQLKYKNMSFEQLGNQVNQDLTDFNDIAMYATLPSLATSMGRGLLGLAKNTASRLGSNPMLYSQSFRSNVARNFTKEQLLEEARKGIEYGIKHFQSVPSAQKKANLLFEKPVNYLDRIKPNESIYIPEELTGKVNGAYSSNFDEIALAPDASLPKNTAYHESLHKFHMDPPKVSSEELKDMFYKIRREDPKDFNIPIKYKENRFGGKIMVYDKRLLNQEVEKLRNTFLENKPQLNISDSGAERLRTVYPDPRGYTKQAYREAIRKHFPEISDLEMEISGLMDSIRKNHFDPKELFARGGEMKLQSGMPPEQAIFRKENYDTLKKYLDTTDNPDTIAEMMMINGIPERDFIKWMNKIIPGLIPPTLFQQALRNFNKDR